MSEFDWIFEDLEKALRYIKEYVKDKDNVYIPLGFVVHEHAEKNWHCELWEKGEEVGTEHFLVFLTSLFGNWLQNKIFDYYSLYDLVLKAMIIAKRKVEGELGE